MRIDTLTAEFGCDDCQQPIRSSVHGVIATDMSSRQYCHGCYLVRASYGAEFDPRCITEIPAEQRKSA